MTTNIHNDAREMGRLVCEAIEEEVKTGRVFEDGYSQRILGYHHNASQWVDLDHEDSPMTEDTVWYLSTDGDLELETELGRFYTTSLTSETVNALR